MNKVVLVARWVLGLMYVIFGLNGFFVFIQPPELAPPGQAFMNALIDTGYMLYQWKAIEVLAGACFLINRFVPAALVISFPVTVNILLFHVFLDPANMVGALLVFVPHIFLIWAYRQHFKGLFKAK